MKIKWDYRTLPALLDELSEEYPIDYEMVVRPSDEHPGTRFDGEKVYVDFNFQMPWGSVQLIVLQGYAVAYGLSKGKGMPTTKFDAGMFHSVVMDMQHYLHQKNDSLGDAFKHICVPAIVEYLDAEIERAATSKGMN